jgi:hypothetical protein
MNGNFHARLKRCSLTLQLAALAAFFVFGLSTSFAQTKEEKAPLTQASKSEVNKMLTEYLRDLIDKKANIPASRKKGYVRASVYPDTGLLLIDLGTEYLPRSSVIEVEDFQRLLSTNAHSLVEDVMTVKEIKFLYGGKEIFYYFPEEEPKPREGKAAAVTSLVPGPIVLNAGHGRYYHHGDDVWKWQRDVFFGMREDTTTPYYAFELAGWLINRSAETPVFTRSYEQDLHAASQEWWTNVAARYHLQQQYPNNPEIWRNRPNGTEDDREYLEDINSRPLFANHVGASVLLSVHTNAYATDPTVRGTRVYYYPGRVEDQRLALNMLCGMKEQIRAVPAYATWAVQDTPVAENHGETRLATMPAVIAEVGFHTNAQDAAALQDQTFRAAATRGMEKGYRMYKLGAHTCQPFQVTSIPNVSGAHNTDIPVFIHFLGFPQFPVKASISFVTCAAGWNCTPYTKTINGPTISPMYYTIRCSAPSTTPPGTFTVKTVLTDADGVKTAAVQHSYTC